MKDDQPAFPQYDYNYDVERGVFDTPSAKGGMTLRDYFAAKAMQGLIASGMLTHHAQEYTTRPFDEGEIAGRAFAMADAMLTAREP